MSIIIKKTNVLHEYQKKYLKGCGENQDLDRDWPWMVVLLSNIHNWRLFCGAVLINEWFVMTAAHCLNEYIASSLNYKYFFIAFYIIGSMQ